MDKVIRKIFEFVFVQSGKLINKMIKLRNKFSTKFLPPQHFYCYDCSDEYNKKAMF